MMNLVTERYPVATVALVYSFAFFSSILFFIFSDFSDFEGSFDCVKFWVEIFSSFFDPYFQVWSSGVVMELLVTRVPWCFKGYPKEFILFCL